MATRKKTATRKRTAPKGTAPAPDFLAETKAESRVEEIKGLPGISRKVYARGLSARESRKITESCLRDGKSPDDPDGYDDDLLNLRLLAASIVDARGKRLIPVGREAEIEEMPGPIMSKLQAAAMRVNGLGGEQAGNVLGATTGGGSSTA